ncbi:hypothetical protein BC938DRAFT_480788 [Jimgerdemannia flammicorona]|uniref:SH3 domain-containing protein n=1 Tax=Jimgerdemannia flammicorona TaxID=994334 RepID=A0A433QHP7_9FUNG|nr:hypothetical protein BC938DRAFT_480788 [Jimgerdemannia flammicorona]
MQQHWETFLWRPIYHARARYDYSSAHPMDLSFKRGDTIEVMAKETSDWLNGATSGRFGSFPLVYVERIDKEQPDEERPRIPPRVTVNGMSKNHERTENERPIVPPRRNLTRPPSDEQQVEQKPALPPRRNLMQHPAPTSDEDQAPKPLPPRRNLIQHSAPTSDQEPAPKPLPPRRNLIQHSTPTSDEELAPKSLPPRRNLIQQSTPTSDEEPAPKPLPPRKPTIQRRPLDLEVNREAPSLPPRKAIDEQPPPLPRRPNPVEITPVVPISSKPTAPVVPTASRLSLPTVPSAKKSVPGLPSQHNGSKPGATVAHNGPLLLERSDNYIDDGMSRLSRCELVVESGYNYPLELDESSFAEIDAYARACPPQETATIHSLSRYLTSPFVDPVDKFRAIYVWLTDNIVYNVPAFLDKRPISSKPEDVLRTRSSVCAGYASLFHALSQSAGLTSWVVSGYAKIEPGVTKVEHDPYGKPTNHAWNVVLVNHQYLVVDSTWGTGPADFVTRTTKKEFNPYYFLLPPNKIIYTHLAGTLKEQYLDPPLTEDEFLGLPLVRPLYFDYDVSILYPLPREPILETGDDVVNLYLEFGNIPKGASVLGALSKVGSNALMPGEPVDNSHVIAQRMAGYNARNVFWVRAVCPKRGRYRLELVISKANEPSPSFLTYMVTNHGPGQQLPHFQPFIAPLATTITSPLEGRLARSSGRMCFAITCFERGAAAPKMFLLMTRWENRYEIHKVDEDGEATYYQAEIEVREAGEYMLVFQMASRMNNGMSMPGIAKYTIV